MTEINEPKTNNMTPKQMLRTISYKAIKNTPEPILRLPIGEISKKDLARLVYLLNSELFKMRNELTKLQKEDKG